MIDIDSRQGRLIQRIAGSRLFSRIAPRIVPRLDRMLHRVSRGRWTMSQRLVPILVLTTSGRRSGHPRPVPLACSPQQDGTFVVVGSNFGRTDHPAWTDNLLHQPRATLTFGRQELCVEAHLLNPNETKAIWPSLLKVWPPYGAYQDRSGRNLRVFRLVPEKNAQPIRA